MRYPTLTFSSPLELATAPDHTSPSLLPLYHSPFPLEPRESIEQASAFKLLDLAADQRAGKGEVGVSTTVGGRTEIGEGPWVGHMLLTSAPRAPAKGCSCGSDTQIFPHLC